MAYYSLVDQTGVTGQTLFTFGFPYLSEDHILVYSDGVATTDFTFNSAFVVKLDSALVGSHTIRIQRITPIDEPLVDYQNGSNLNETDLDSVALQMLYLAQEQADALVGGLYFISNASGNWDAGNNRIINVGTPTGTTDAATKAYVDASYSSSGNGHAIGAHIDSVSTSLVKGDLLVVTDQGSGVYKYDKLAVGAAGEMIVVNASANQGMSWSGTPLLTLTSAFNRANNYQTEIDFGTTGVESNTFVITDANVTTSSIITGCLAYVAPTGKDLDELEMDTFNLFFAPGTGAFTVYVTALQGYVAGPYKLNYHVG